MEGLLTEKNALEVDLAKAHVEPTKINMLQIALAVNLTKAQEEKVALLAELKK